MSRSILLLLLVLGSHGCTGRSTESPVANAHNSSAASPSVASASGVSAAPQDSSVLPADAANPSPSLASRKNKPVKLVPQQAGDSSSTNPPGSETPKENLAEMSTAAEPLHSLPRRALEIEEALRLGERAAKNLVAQHPSIPDANELLARFEFRFGSPEAAANLWRKIVAAHPRYTYAQIGLGDVCATQGDHDAASKYYRQAAISMPQDVTLQVKLAASLAESGQHQSAREILETAIEYDRNHVAAHKELGAVLMQQQEFSLAETAYTRAAALAPDDPNAHFGLAQAAARNGNRVLARMHQKLHCKYRRAVRHELADGRRSYDDAQAIAADMADHLTKVGRVYASLQDSKQAQVAWQQAASVNLSAIECRELLSQSYQQVGNLDLAAWWQQSVVQLSPEKFEPTFRLAILTSAAGNINAAEKIVMNFVESNPNHGTARMTLAQFYVDVSPSLEKAIASAAKGAELTQLDSDFVFLSALHEYSGDSDLAGQAMEEARSLAKPDGKDPEELLRQLREKLQSNPRLAP